MSVNDFVKKAEKRSEEAITRSYREIDMLYWEINFLNDLLLRYINKKAGLTYTQTRRDYKMAEIRRRIPELYKEIVHCRACIKAEKSEIERIYKTYGYPSEKEYYRYEDEEDSYYNTYRDDSSYDFFNDSDDFKEYKYNSVTGVFE